MNLDLPRATKRFPGSTYRLQFNRSFTLTQATAILDYLQQLGISDIYASPLLQAGHDSTHGYDICCFSALNPSIGTGEDFERLQSRRRELGLGLLLDMVPNHMGAVLSNGWWLDVLEKGRQSRYADFFDINWNPPNPALQNKVLLPTLGDHYGRVLERGELKLEFTGGRFWIAYFERRFPVNEASLPDELRGADRQRNVPLFNSHPGEPRTFDRLHALIQRQHYRLAYWKVGSEEINYRRFFDVTELVSLRMDRPEVFAESHRLVLEWIASGHATGLRIDHPDGLRDPRAYFERLQSEAAAATGNPLYVVAEKILSAGEQLPDDWPVDGTTGYDFLNRVNGLFVSAASEEAMDRTCAEFCEGSLPDFGREGFHALVLESKRRILETSLISELESLAHRLQAVAMTTRAGIDFTFSQLKSALKEVIAAFPVYRTYLSDSSQQPGAADRAVIEKAVTEANARENRCDPALFEFLRQLLTLELLPDLQADAVAPAREFVARFQQLTGPVMAKGLEDTSFYNFNRLISLNEVGGEPAVFGCSVQQFHNANADTQNRWPHTLLATATHDMKRGEDARARINVLSELPDEWREAVNRWKAWNAAEKTVRPGSPAPSANDEYLFYQSLVGALPHDSEQPKVLKDFRERFTAFAVKAVKEAKTSTSWLEPNADYEQAVQQFAGRILSDSAENRFLDDLRKFCARVSFFGRINSLAQTVLKIASPGVPDFYQGTELWDFSFVDPDNRRPVDFELRKRLLTHLQRRPTSDAPPTIDDSGIAKLFVIWRGLQLRSASRAVFDSGGYIPLQAFGNQKDHVCAFARTNSAGTVLAIVPRLSASLTGGRESLPIGERIWGDAILPLDSRLPAVYENVFTAQRIAAVEKEGIRSIRMADALQQFPVALLKGVQA